MNLIEYIKTLGLDGDNLSQIVDAMPEERAKEILKIIITLIKENWYIWYLYLRYEIYNLTITYWYRSGYVLY